MALLDENKLQGNVISILGLLREDIKCCKIVAAQFMCMDGTTVVWVTTNQNGEISVYDGPGGSLVATVGTLSPLTSDGQCPPI